MLLRSFFILPSISSVKSARNLSPHFNSLHCFEHCNPSIQFSLNYSFSNSRSLVREREREKKKFLRIIFSFCPRKKEKMKRYNIHL